MIPPSAIVTLGFLSLLWAISPSAVIASGGQSKLSKGKHEASPLEDPKQPPPASRKERPPPSANEVQHNRVAGEVMGLVRDFESGEFIVRRTASLAITKLMDSDDFPIVVSTLEKQLKTATDAEVRSRISSLLELTKIHPDRLVEQILQAYKNSADLGVGEAALASSFSALSGVGRELGEILQKYPTHDKAKDTELLRQANELAMGALREKGIEVSGETLFPIYTVEEGKARARIKTGGREYSLSIASAFSGNPNLHFYAVDPIRVDLDSLTLTPIQKRAFGLTGSLALSAPTFDGERQQQGDFIFHARRFPKEIEAQLEKLLPEYSFEIKRLRRDLESLEFGNLQESNPLQFTIPKRF